MDLLEHFGATVTITIHASEGDRETVSSQLVGGLKHI